MKTEYHKWYSRHLGREMELKVYGRAGTPMMIFPCSSGRFYDFEDRGMIETIRHHIEKERIMLFAVDSIDPESWDSKTKLASEKAARHNDYENYIVNEVVPFIRSYVNSYERIIATGASMGASHSVNIFLKHPSVFGGTVALSGVYNFREFLDDYQGDDLNVYYNSPLEFLPNLTDDEFLSHYRNSRIIVCVGQGAWEEPMVSDTKLLKEIFEQKEIPALIDVWGQDVNHDWDWWLKQFPYFVDILLDWK